MTVPDYCEPLIGWRFWFVHGNRLRSRGQTWEPYQRYEATHVTSSGLWRDEYEVVPCDGVPCDVTGAAPYGHGCGVYALKSEQALRNDLRHGLGRRAVYGRVALWGRVVEHEHGYRAQYAYPIEFIRADACDGVAIAREYGISFKEHATWKLETLSDDWWLSPFTIRSPPATYQPTTWTWLTYPPPPSPTPPLRWTSRWLCPPDDLTLIKKPKAQIHEQPTFRIHKPTQWWKDNRTGMWLRTDGA